MPSNKRGKRDKNKIAYKKSKAYRREIAKRNRILATVFGNVALALLLTLCVGAFCIFGLSWYTSDNTAVTEGICVSAESKNKHYFHSVTFRYITLDNGKTFCMSSDGAMDPFDGETFWKNYKDKHMTLIYSKTRTLEGYPEIVALRDAENVYLSMEDNNTSIFISRVIVAVFGGVIYGLLSWLMFWDLSSYLKEEGYKHEVH